MRETAVRLLQKLTQAHGASGHERAVRRIFREELDLPLSGDKLGSVIAEKRGAGPSPRVMVAAHMDEVGLVVQSITRSGLVKFLPLGGWWAHTLLAQRVRILTREGHEVLGVVGAKPPHFLSESERDKLLKLEEMFIDVGASSAEDVTARFGIGLGDTIVPESPFTAMHDPDLLLCKAFDDRVGVALTIHSLQRLKTESHPNTVYGVGTVQEEMGMRGAQTSAFSVNPDVAIVLEGTPADDHPSIPEDERQGVMGRGVQIRVLDPSAIMNRPLIEHVLSVAQTHNIAHQVAVRRSGGTDARPIQLHGAGTPVVVLGVPARYIHTHNSMIHIGDYLSALALVVKLIQSLDERTVKRFTDFSN